MIKTLSLTLLAVLAVAGEADVALSPAAAKAVADCEAQIQKAFEVTDKSLRAEIDRLTKAGKAREAHEVKKTLLRFRTDAPNHVNNVAPMPAADDPLDLLGDRAAPDLAKEIQGVWVEVGGSSGSITITNEGVKHSGGAKATMTIDKNSSVTLVWENGWKIADLKFNREGKLFLGKNIRPDGTLQGLIALAPLR
jgi:hypothetical protein